MGERERVGVGVGGTYARKEGASGWRLCVCVCVRGGG